MSTRNDLPSDTAGNFSQRVRETLMTYLGRQGDPLDRGLTIRDLLDNGIVAIKSGFSLNNLIGRVTMPIGPGSALVTYEVDLTPPPTPTGFIATALWSNLLIETAAQTYTHGNGHLKTVVYGATWISGPLPVFGDAVKITEFGGTVYAYPTSLGTTWHLWAKWQSNDGVLSSAPAGGTNGVVAATGRIGNVDLNPLIIEAGNLAAGSVTAIKFAPTIEPVTLVSSVPGVKSTSSIFNSTDGFLYRWNGATYVRTVPAADIAGQLADAQIAALAAAKVTGQLTNAQLADLAATKLTGQIVGTQITDGAIVSAKIAAGAIVAGKIAAGAIVAADIAADTITATQIAAGAITASELSAGSVTAGKIAALSITAGDIAANAIVAGKIATDAITAGTIAAGAITAGKIAANAIAVGSAAIENGAIRNALIANLAVDNAKIADLVADKITAGTLQAGVSIQSTGYSASYGFKLDAATGKVFARDAEITGKITATSGLIGGNTIDSSSIRTQAGYNSGTGFYLGSNGTMSIGNSSGNRLTWNGSSLNINGEINVGAYTSFAWPAVGAGGGAHLSSAGLALGSLNDGKYFVVTAVGNIYAPGFSVVNGAMEISQVNVINTLNIAGNAVTVPLSVSGNGSGTWIYPGTLILQGVSGFQYMDSGFITAIQITLISAGYTNCRVQVNLRLLNGGIVNIFDTSTTTSLDTITTAGAGSIPLPHPGNWRVEVNIGNDWVAGEYQLWSWDCTAFGSKR